jgi:ubiquitin conjugation factor E4 B
MEPGITKILKTRPTTEQKTDEGSSMDVDPSDSNTELTSRPTSSSAMEVSENPVAAAPAPETPAPVEPAAPQPTAEELRLMRLRRFGGPASTSTEPTKPVDMPAKTTTAATKVPAAAVSPSSPSMATSLGSSPSNPSSGTLSARLTPSATPFNTPSHTPIDSSFLSTSPGVGIGSKAPHTPSDKTGLSAPVPFDYNAWVHKTICNIFSVRSNAPIAPSSTSAFGSEIDKNPSKSHVFDMQSILNSKQQNETPQAPTSPHAMDITIPVITSPSLNQFSIDDVDLILMNILSTSAKELPAHFSPIEYFANCLARLDGLKRLHPISATTTNVKANSSASAPLVLVELGTRLYNFFALVLTNPTMFAAFSEPLLENPEYVSTHLVRVLGRGLLHKEHLLQLAAAIGENSMSTVFEPVFLRCAALARMHSAHVQFDAASQVPIHAFRALVGAGKPFVSVLVKHPRWGVKPSDTGKAVDLSLLGCMLTYTPLFALGSTETEGSMVALPMTSLSEILFDVLSNAKEPTLDWLAMVLHKNKDATKMGAGETISSTGFANSFATAMLRLSKPFMDRLQDKGRYANYDPNYFTRSKRMASFFDSSETRIVADKSTFEAWREELEVSSKGAAYAPTFITECFHMTILALIQQARIYRIYADVFERHAEMKRTQARGTDIPGIDNLGRIKAVIEDVIFAPSHFQEAFLFWEMVGIWLARVASTPDGQTLSGSTRFDTPAMPLPSTPPKAYQCLPEMILESYAGFFMFAALYWEKFSDQEHTDLMNSLVTLLASPSYVKNPHIRVKMVQVLTVLMPRGKGGRLQPKRVSPFDSNFVVSNLGPALTLLYCDVERTGSASQFYDRLNARHELSSILVFLWSDRPGHKESIVSYWDQHPENFKSFADKLLNDSIFLLDEGLSKLFESRAAQVKLDSGSLANDGERREAAETVERGARQTRSFMVLLRESLRILSMVALNHPRLFMRADMHERLATSLNYCLYQIHGPRRNELKLPNPEKYEFEPAWVVDKLCSSILSFATHDKSFIEYLAKDTRSYSDELYMNAVSFVEKNSQPDFELKPSAWRAMAAAVKDYTQHAEALEEELGDIPDDFLDPLMATLMTDPVILPSSRMTLDRSVIERSLLADPIDPYNRSPLTADQLIPDTELKQKIDAFIAEKRKKR